CTDPVSTKLSLLTYLNGIIRSRRQGRHEIDTTEHTWHNLLRSSHLLPNERITPQQMPPYPHPRQNALAAIAELRKSQICIVLYMLLPSSSYFWRISETTSIEVFQKQYSWKGHKRSEHMQEISLIQIEHKQDPIHLQGTLHLRKHLLQRQ